MQSSGSGTAREEIAALERASGTRATVLPLRAIIRDADGTPRCSCPNVRCRKVGKHAARRWRKSLYPAGTQEIVEGVGHALITGERSGVFVIDTDGAEADAWFLDWIGDELPDTYVVKTPSDGRHYYFRRPSFAVRTSKSELAPNVDVRGDNGGIIVLPGSPHKSGKTYDVEYENAIADAPAKLLAWPGLRGREDADANDDEFLEEASDAPAYQSTREQRIRAAVKRNAALPASVSGSPTTDADACNAIMVTARVCGLTDRGMVLEAIEAWNKRCVDKDGQPYPWSGVELDRLISRALSEDCRTPWEANLCVGLDTPMDLSKLADLRARATDEDEQTLAAFVAGRASVAKLNPNVWNLTRGDSVEIAERIKDELGSKFRLVFTEGAFFVYDAASGVWVSEGVEKLLRELVFTMSGAKLPGGTTKNKAGEVTQRDVSLKLFAHSIRGALETLGHMIADDKFFEHAVDGLACPNGFLMLTEDGVELRAHSPDNRARNAYPVAYEPDARSETWETFLLDLFRDDADAGDKIALLGEFFGGALFGLSTSYQKCIAALGTGSNGKSELLKVIDDVFPTGTVSAYSPQKLENEYWRSKLPGVLLNAVSELPSATILASEAFKSIVTGDRIDAREPTQPVITFRPKAGHFFGANKLPGTTDQSHGFWRRFVVLGFNREFGADAERDISRRILADGRPGILAWLVDGAVRLRARREYTIPPSHADLLKAWRNDSDTVALWLDEHVEATADPALGTRSATLYASYAHWARDSGFRPVAINTFGQRLQDRGHKKTGKAKEYALRVMGCGSLATVHAVHVVNRRQTCDGLSAPKTQ